MSGAVLSATGLGTSPWGPRLLDGIDLRLAAGSITAIIGPNGAGKSSLLHTLAGGLSHDRGELLLWDRPLQAWPRLARARAIGLLPQHSPLNFPFRVAEVIQLGRTPHASGAAWDRQVVDAVMAATDTAKLRDRPYTELSGGERQRVQLARVLAQLWRPEDSPARLLLLDEPTAGLDLKHQQLMLQAVHQLAAGGVAVAWVLHDFNLAAAHADHLLVLAGGRAISQGPPAAVLTPTLFREVFEVDMRVDIDPRSGVPLVLSP